MITACGESGRAVAIVSNNSGQAVRAYLERHSLDDRVDLVVARTIADPAQLKPSSYFIDQAVAELRAQSTECVLVGDSITDIQAGLAASVVTIGYANRPGKHKRLADAGATALWLDARAHGRASRAAGP